MSLSSLIAQHDPFQSTIDVHKADSVLRAHLDLDHRVIIIDLRTEGEYAGGFIEGAINRNYYGPGFDDTLAGLEKGKEYLIYCASGGRSNAAFNKMKALGFKMVYNMLGGINTWKSAGYPIVTGSTGVDYITKNAPMVALYPNPITSESVFVNSDHYMAVTISVFNIQGRNIIKQDLEGGLSVRLNYDRLESGVYFFQVCSDGIIIQSGKFMKN